MTEATATTNGHDKAPVLPATKAIGHGYAVHKCDPVHGAASCNSRIKGAPRVVDEWATVTCKSCLSWAPKTLVAKAKDRAARKAEKKAAKAERVQKAKARGKAAKNTPRKRYEKIAKVTEALGATIKRIKSKVRKKKAAATKAAKAPKPSSAIAAMAKVPPYEEAKRRMLEDLVALERDKDDFLYRARQFASNHAAVLGTTAWLACREIAGGAQEIIVGIVVLRAAVTDDATFGPGAVVRP